jgi:hypothetical protein
VTIDRVEAEAARKSLFEAGLFLSKDGGRDVAGAPFIATQ